ncbi:GNAT family N-acetyltransferase [Dyella marensis]|uniref:N-acetylglutamate synthase, GNAT family n=1 Tax=Dyella marensis TaxID=500610 RepID=A0A1I1XRK0_9GAMM|nr:MULTISPECIES: GNAT family N-acetyltransferase [Dyella]SFE09871.1 N-acetylglutamate synthase, GNAT family [Dyella marensis]
MTRVRQAVQGDAGTLTELRCAFLEEMGQQLPDGFADHLRDWIETALLAGRLHAWLAEHEGRVVGSAAVNPYPHMPSANYPTGQGWYLLNVYVKPAQRQGGVGTALLAAVGSAARERGIDALTLHANTRARALYERHGFKLSTDAMRLGLA